MQIKQTKKEALHCAFEVSLTAQEIEEKVTERLSELGKTVNIPGFRPGKVPMNILKSKYEQAVMGEVLEKAVNDSTMQAINENELRPAMQPKIEVKKFEAGEGLEYTMEVELLPEIKLGDFKKLKLEKKTAEPEEKSITEALDRIADANTSSEAIKEKRASKKGDIVIIDFDGSVDGEKKPGMKGEGHSLELGSNSFIEGFEDQLVGAKAGDHVTVNVTFPDPYASPELAGKDAVFEVDVQEIHKKVKAKLDDDFAKKLGLDDLAALKDAVKGQIQSEYDTHTRMHLKRALLDALDEEHKFDLPAGMVDAEYEAILHQVVEHDHNHGADHKHDDSSLSDDEKAEYRSIAERRVKLGLILAECGRENKVEVNQQELQQAVIREAQRYPGQEAQVFEFYQKNPQALENLRAPLYEDKVVDFILEIATINTVTVTVEDLLSDPEGDEAPKKAKKSAAKKDKKTSKSTAKKKETSKESEEKKTKKSSDKKAATTKKKAAAKK